MSNFNARISEVTIEMDGLHITTVSAPDSKEAAPDEAQVGDFHMSLFTAAEWIELSALIEKAIRDVTADATIPNKRRNQMNEQQLAAVKQALEALMVFRYAPPAQRPLVLKAIADLEQVIAQDALYKMAEDAVTIGLSYNDWPKIGCVNHDCDQCKAVQEPVIDHSCKDTYELIMKWADIYAAQTGNLYAQAAQDPSKVARMADERTMLACVVAQAISQPPEPDLLSALKRILDEPNNTMSDGKALKEIIRIARRAITKATGEKT